MRLLPAELCRRPDHIRVVLHLLRRPVRDVAAVVEYGDAVRDVHHDAHVVLDQDDGRAPLGVDVENEAGNILLLLLVHAAHRLVEQQQLRVERERAAELDALAQAIGEGAGRLLADVLELQELDEFLDPRAVAHLLSLRRTPVDERGEHTSAHMHVPPEHDVVEHGKATEQRNVLERAGDAELGDGGGFGVGDVAAFELDSAAGRAVEAADHVQ
jgi:hypothetical protein